MKVEVHQVWFADRIVDLPVVMQWIVPGVSIQSVTLVVLPNVEGISAVEPITPHEHVQERIVERSENVVVPPIMEGISAGEVCDGLRLSYGCSEARVCVQLCFRSPCFWYLRVVTRMCPFLRPASVRVVAIETVLPEIGLFVSSTGNFNSSILDHMKKLKNKAFVGAVFRFSIMVGWWTSLFCFRKYRKPWRRSSSTFAGS